MWPAEPADIAALGLPLIVKPLKVGSTVGLSIVRAAADITRAGGFKALIVFTLSGRTARLLSGSYPGVPIFAMTPRAATQRAMCLYRGVIPVLMPFPGSSDAMIREGEDALLERGYLSKGDAVVVVAGFTELKGVANMVKVVRI